MIWDIVLSNNFSDALTYENLQTSGLNLHTFLIGNVSYGKFLSLKNTQLFHKLIM